MKNKKVFAVIVIIVALLGLAVFCLAAAQFQIIAFDELPLNFMGTFLGAIVTALITVILLNGQSAAEEIKERNVKVFETKSKIFQEYITEIWKIWEDQIVTPNEYQKLTSSFYILLMPYLKQTSIDSIAKNMANIGDCLNPDVSNYENLRKNIFEIVNTLSAELGLGGQIDPEAHKLIEDKMFPVLFKKALLDKLNELLAGENSPLVPGVYYTIEGKGEYICFWFREFKGCQIIIGSFNKDRGDDIWMCLYIDDEVEELNKFRNDGDKFGRRFVPLWREDKKNQIHLQEELPANAGEDLRNCPSIGKIAFDVPKILEPYRMTWQKVVEIIAKRAKYYFECPQNYYGKNKEESGITMVEFLGKYIGGAK